jgi:serine protease AprX
MTKTTSPVVAVSLALILTLTCISPAYAGVTFSSGQGVVLTGAEGVVLTGAEGVVLTGAEGVVLTGAEGVVLTGAEGVVLTGAEAVTYTGLDGVVLTGAEQATGIQSLDPDLAVLLNNLPDTSAINVFIVYYSQPSASDLSDLQAAGILGGTIYRNLPMVMVNATRGQIAAISKLPAVRSIYSNKTTQFFTHDTRTIIGQTSVLSDPALTQRNNGIPISGQGVTVAVLDTGIDGTHPDLPYGTKVVQNARVADLQGSAPAFLYPVAVEGLADTDLVMGHGTFVASVIAGTGAASGNYYGGIAPGANLLGVSAGDASLFFVLSGIDYILSHQMDQNIKIVNCSFGINGVFDVNDPVNIATRIMHDAGITVVFSAGNSGSTPNSLNPYSVAPWVIGVGSGTKGGSLSTFSSRGAAAYGMYHPTLIAPGENIVAARATGINVVGTAGLAGVLVSPQNDLQNIPPAYLPRYTMSSGTSFAAPHVSGTAALMLQANPSLTPDQVKAILQQTATPMLGYSTYEVGAGYLNAYAAVREAAFNPPYGAFRARMNNGLFTISRDPIVSFSGQVAPGATVTRSFQVPQDTMMANITVGWINNNGGLISGLLPTTLSVAAHNGAQAVSSSYSALLTGGILKTGSTLTGPSPGTWTISISNLGNFLTGSVQTFTATIETFHVTYNGVSDIAELSAADQQTVKCALRTGLMVPQATGFAPGSPASRLDLARALALGGGAHLPQYLPATPDFVDLPDDAGTGLVESITHSPNGNLMGAVGPNFNPQSNADRVTAAIAAVKELGLDQLAQSTTANPGINDWSVIPASERGYVAVAISRNLMNTGVTGNFRPFDAITRAELAATAVALQQATR